MNFKYRVSGTKIEKLKVWNETIHFVEFYRDKTLFREKKTSLFQQWYAVEGAAVHAVLSNALRGIEDAEKRLQCARESYDATLTQIQNLA